jgi:Rieske Fe-S protein
MKRREFVKTTAVATGLIAAGCGNNVRPAPILPTPLTVNNGVLTIPLKNADGSDRYPDLVPVGGAISIPIAKPLPPGAPDELLLVHLGDTRSDPLRYVAMKSACPHAACPLGWSPDDLAVECPCHGSQFAISADANGCPTITVMHLPAMQGPPVYKTVHDFDNDIVTITFAPSGPLTAKFVDYPALMSPGGLAVVTDTGSCSGAVVVVRKDDTTAIAFSAVCTHMDCLVAPQPAAAPTLLLCPCHGSEFDLSGGLLRGPAPSSLPMVKATVQTDGIVIG